MIQPLQLRVEPDPILRTSCHEVASISDEIRALVEAMVTCMDDRGGIGLAAPQVGLTHNIFVTRAPEDKARVFINPTLISTSEKKVDIEEGCLSIPKTYATISRSRDIVVQAYDQNGTQFSLETSGMAARVILHEYDHLHGVLFWDYLTAGKQKKIASEIPTELTVHTILQTE